MRDIINVQHVDARNPPKANINFSGTGFVSVLDEKGNPVQKTDPVPNMITKEILWQLNHGKQGNDADKWNLWEIQQMFTNCALGDGNWDSSRVPNNQIATYAPQQGVDLARSTNPGMFHLDNAKTAFQDSYYTSEGYCGTDDRWDAATRTYTFKFRRSYQFNMAAGSAFICREVGLFAMNGNNPGGALPPVPTWVTTNPGSGAFQWRADPERPSADNALGYPWGMCARLVLPTPVKATMNQSIVVTYDFVMTVDCNARDISISAINEQTGAASAPLTGKLSFAFPATRTEFSGFGTKPVASDANAPGVAWSALNNKAAWNTNGNSTFANTRGGNRNKGFLSPSNMLGASDGTYGQYRAAPASATQSVFAESDMSSADWGTQIPDKTNEESNFHYQVKSNHARFQTTYTYEIRLPNRDGSGATIYPNEFNIGGLLLYLDTINYDTSGISPHYQSPIEWTNNRQYFISVSVSISFNNPGQGGALTSDRNIVTEDWGYLENDIANHVYSSFGEWGSTPVLASSPALGQKGYFLREWNDGSAARKMYFPIWYRNINGSPQWWLEDDLPVAGGKLPDGSAMPATNAGVAYHEWDRNMASKEDTPANRKPFRRGFMIDDRDGNVYMCLCAHFANSTGPINEYRWVHAEPFRLRQAAVDYAGAAYSPAKYIGTVYDGAADYSNGFNAYGNASSNPRGRFMTREQMDGRLYSQYEIMNNGNSPAFAAAYSSSNVSGTTSPSSGKLGIAPAGWHVPSDGEQGAFFHGLLNGSEGNNGNDNVTPTGGGNDSRLMLMSPHAPDSSGVPGKDSFGLGGYYAGYRSSGGWYSRGSILGWWSSSSQTFRYQYFSYVYVYRSTSANSQSRFSLVCFKD